MRDCENCKHRVMKVEVGKGTPPEHFWGCECWECEFEPITKNNLGVDCISRADVLKLMKDNWHTHNGDWAMQESMDDIRALPSVTPQPCEDAVSRQAVLDLIADYDLSMGQVVRGIHALPSVTPQEPKPMVEIDLYSVIKQKYIEREVLDKIRAELHSTAEMHEDGDYYLRDEWIDEYFDKYKAESEE